MNKEEPIELIIPDNFRGVIYDFTNDLTTTFPEYSHLWQTWNNRDCPETEIIALFKHIMEIMPERFFDILYQNEEMFQPTSTINTEFFPGVDFKLLFNCTGISETIRQTMWKYFQLLLFTVINSIKNKSIFGDTMNLFEGIDETELQTKLQETMGNIGDFFTNIKTPSPGTDDTSTDTFLPEDFPDAFKSSFNFENMSKGMPNPNEMHEHLKSMFDGKIGKLAKEMAEEISSDMNGLFGEDAEIKTTQDVIKTLMKNPKKMMDLVKLVGNKLNAKMQSGELSQDDIMKEAGDIIGKMKDMGGGDNMKDFLKNMTNMAGMGKTGKVNTAAVTNMFAKERTKERMRNKMERQKQAPAVSQSSLPVFNGVIEQKDQNNYVFKIDSEIQEKSFIRPPEPPNLDQLIYEIETSNNAAALAAANNNKKKENKKKKSKK